MTNDVVSLIKNQAAFQQRRAADPCCSVWVSASAGTGKTRVLIDRVLRLLLPRADGSKGTRPDKILCLTYTRAAASEMTERLLARLSSWVNLAETDLVRELHLLLDETPTSFQLQAARQLFAHLVDGPEQVKLMTIHAFCQSILARFPLEAGLPPHFSLVQGAAMNELLVQARYDVLKNSCQNTDLHNAIATVMAEMSDDTLTNLLDRLFNEKRQLTYALGQYSRLDRLRVMNEQFDLPADYGVSVWEQEIRSFKEENSDSIHLLVQGFFSPEATKAEKEMGLELEIYQLEDSEKSTLAFNRVRSVFFDKNGKRRSAGRHQGIRKNNPLIGDLYEKIGDGIDRLYSRFKMIDLIRINLALLHVAEEVMTIYDQIKYHRGLLDFDDVIRFTLRLLCGPDGRVRSDVLSWVMYKLDGGIDHILVDEAQDTNPEQWQIIRALTESFFDDMGLRSERSRTLFVVGDQKQSIYSFQGADPQSFEESIDHLSRGSMVSPHHVFERIPLNISFRSGAAVLQLVDHVFDDPSLRADVRAHDPVIHVVSRIGQAGRVDLWPLEEKSEKTIRAKSWKPGIEIQPNDDVYDRLAVKIADEIERMLDQGEMLLTYHRPIQPRDIMILLSKREPFMARLVAALRARKIPVGGLDRLHLVDEISVLDVLSAVRFVLLPDDDLNLACLLKSPLLGGDDDILIDLAPTRSGSLWDSLQKSDRYPDFVTYLQDIQEAARKKSPYDFIAGILNDPCPGDRLISGESSGLRALKARLGDDCAEPLDEMMNEVLRGDMAGESLVRILYRLSHENPEIKREGETSQNVVRLMTVHGSKGLEAPVVILPDTVKTDHPSHQPTIFWPDATGMKLPIWSPRVESRPVAFDRVLESAADAARAEYNRLLYVALTRAQDRLIIAGAEKTKADPQSWYFTVRQGFERMSHLPGFYRSESENPSYFFEVLQTEQPDRAELNNVSDLSENIFSPTLFVQPDFLTGPLPTEPVPLRPYRAEAASGASLIQSPLVMREAPVVFARGLLIHKLLQVLPNLPFEQQRLVAEDFLSVRAQEFSTKDRDEMLNDVMGILRHPDFSDLFGPESRAEVPVTGVLRDGRLIAGQIDRLCVMPHRILILDYKTGRAAPQTPQHIPLTYRAQMAAYREILSRIYPDRSVEAAIIWTSGPVLMQVDE